MTKNDKSTFKNISFLQNSLTKIQTKTDNIKANSKYYYYTIL